MTKTVVRTATAGLAAFGLLVLLLYPHSIRAQQGGGNPPPWMQLTVVHVAPPMLDEYIAVQRDLTTRLRRPPAPAATEAGAGGGGGGGGGRGGGGGGAAAGGPNFRIVSRSELGDVYGFVIATPLNNLAALDAAVRPPADAELTLLNSKAQKYVTGQQTFVVRNMPEIDKPLPSNQAPSLMVVNLVKVAPGREQDYYNLMKSDFFPHFDKANVFHTTGSVVFGGEAGFIHQYYYPNYAALDAGSPVVKALGPAGAQAVTAKLAGIVTSTEQWITRLVPELSFGPWSPAGRGQ